MGRGGAVKEGMIKVPRALLPQGLTGGSAEMSVIRPIPGVSHSGVLPPGVHFSASEVGDLCSGCLRTPEPGEMRGVGFCYVSKPRAQIQRSPRLYLHCGVLHVVVGKIDLGSQGGGNPRWGEAHPCLARARPRVAGAG